MSRKGGEIVNLDDDFGARRPMGRAPQLSSGRPTRLSAGSPNPSSSKFVRSSGVSRPSNVGSASGGARKRLGSDELRSSSSHDDTFFMGEKVEAPFKGAYALHISIHPPTHAYMLARSFQRIKYCLNVALLFFIYDHIH